MQFLHKMRVNHVDTPMAAAPFISIKILASNGAIKTKMDLCFSNRKSTTQSIINTEWDFTKLGIGGLDKVCMRIIICKVPENKEGTEFFATSWWTRRASILFRNHPQNVI